MNEAFKEALMFWPCLIAELLCIVFDGVGMHQTANKLFNWSQMR